MKTLLNDESMKGSISTFVEEKNDIKSNSFNYGKLNSNHLDHENMQESFPSLDKTENWSTLTDDTLLAKISTVPEQHNKKDQKNTNKDDITLNQNFLSKDLMIKSVKDRPHGNLKMQQSSNELLSSSRLYLQDR